MLPKAIPIKKRMEEDDPFNDQTHEKDTLNLFIHTKASIFLFDFL